MHTHARPKNAMATHQLVSLRGLESRSCCLNVRLRGSFRLLYTISTGHACVIAPSQPSSSWP